jgi:hypothetical protein
MPGLDVKSSVGLARALFSAYDYIIIETDYAMPVLLLDPDLRVKFTKYS